MAAIFVFTLFDPRSGRPRCTGIKAGNQVVIKELYRPGAGKTIHEIRLAREYIRDLILNAEGRGLDVVTSDFKDYFAAFELPLRQKPYNVYDLQLPEIPLGATADEDSWTIKIVLDKMAAMQLRPYHLITSNAAVVYQSMENVGVLLGYSPVKPIWSQRTYSGRSKTTGFNIQGSTDDDDIRAVGASESDVLLHFDWLCADIRVAAYLSGDKALSAAFLDSDPYTVIMNAVNSTAQVPLTREEAKSYLLKAINSMDADDKVIGSVYPDLSAWIAKCRDVTELDGHLESVLGRKFKRSATRSKLAVINGALQGSVAHAMQITIRRLWERIGPRLVAEIHDSLVVTCTSSAGDIKQVVDATLEIMARPFTGYIADDLFFPVKVSLGKRWRHWQPWLICRSDGVTRVTNPQSPPDDVSGT